VSSEVYVIFKGDRGRWWSRFLHTKIRHCFIIEPSLGKYIVYEKDADKMMVYNVEHINDIIGPTDITVSYMKEIQTQPLLMLNTCVGYTKQFLGIRNPFIWTPYQLYKHIKG